MQGVTTALVAYLLTCVVFPNLVKNRPQYYAALAAVCFIIVLDAIAVAINPTSLQGFRVFAYTAVGFLQVGAILLLFLASGGITWRHLANDMRQAYEVIRRGGEDKEIIIPLSGEMARLRAEREREAAERRTTQDEPPREPIVINDPTPAPPATSESSTTKKPDESGSIPLVQ
jgi:hypothetical protein